MSKYTKEDLIQALKVITPTISKCEKMQPKFVEGTSQHTLLKNRIKALQISQALIASENVIDMYSKDELTDALRPITSIISKCEKAQLKFEEGTSHYTRFQSMIQAMYIAKAFIENAIVEKHNPSQSV